MSSLRRLVNGSLSPQQAHQLLAVIDSMLAVPHDARGWDLVDAAGLALRGFPPSKPREPGSRGQSCRRRSAPGAMPYAAAASAERRRHLGAIRGPHAAGSPAPSARLHGAAAVRLDAGPEHRHGPAAPSVDPDRAVTPLAPPADRPGRAVLNGGERWNGSRPRWDGHVVVTDACIHWFYGELAARWLGGRGVHLNTVMTNPFRTSRRSVEQETAEAAPIPGDAPRLTNSGALVDHWIAEQHARRVLMTCDDDYWQPRPWTKFPPAFADALRNQEAAMRLADEIVVPTARLAERMQRFGRPITVIPPTLPPRAEWPAPRRGPREPGLRIGYVATWWYSGELVAMGPTLLQFLAHYPDVTFVLGGGPFDEGKTCVEWVVGHPQVEIHRGHVSLPGYYRFLASLDLDGFICPLLDLPFNTAKPSLKPAEAAMIGLPVIASRVGSSAEDLRHEETALLVENTPEAWLAALTRWVEDAELRAHLAARGLEWAATRTIDSTGPLWAELWAR